MWGLKLRTGLALVLGLATGGFAMADQLAVSTGSWQTLRPQYRKAEVDVDYRSDLSLWILRPHVGALIAGDGDYYVYGGVYTDLKLFDHIVLTLNSSIGGYDGKGFNLGSHFEFRNGAELSYRFNNDWRIGGSFYHISNAGITRANGGSESTLLVVTAPLPW
jgi:hypothetical protein